MTVKYHLLPIFFCKELNPVLLVLENISFYRKELLFLKSLAKISLWNEQFCFYKIFK
jgi:hypothetical protein